MLLYEQYKIENIRATLINATILIVVLFFLQNKYITDEIIWTKNKYAYLTLRLTFITNK